MSLITGAIGLVESAQSGLLGQVGKVFGFGTQLYPSLDRTLGRLYRAGAPEGFGRAFYGYVLNNAEDAQGRQILGAQLWDQIVTASGLPTTSGGTDGYETGAPVPVRSDAGLQAFLDAARGGSGPWGTSAGNVDWRSMARLLRLDQAVVPTPPQIEPGSQPYSTPPVVPGDSGDPSIEKTPPPGGNMGGGGGLLLAGLALLLFARR